MEPLQPLLLAKGVKELATGMEGDGTVAYQGETKSQSEGQRGNESIKSLGLTDL